MGVFEVHCDSSIPEHDGALPYQNNDRRKIQARRFCYRCLFFSHGRKEIRSMSVCRYCRLAKPLLGTYE